MAQLSIVITHYKTPRLLLKLLKSLDRKPSDWELRVVESNAQKGTRIIMQKEFPRIRYIPFTTNVGYAKLANAGIKHTKGEYILLINADISIKPREIEKMLSFSKTHPNAGAVGVTDCFRFPTIGSILARRSAWGKTPWGKKVLLHYQMEDYTRKKPEIVDWVRGDCWMIKKSVYKTVGAFDERFFMYCEDIDWCRRARQKGFFVYFLPGVKIRQIQHGASRQRTLRGLRYRFTHLISFIKYLRKYNLS